MNTQTRTAPYLQLLVILWLGLCLATCSATAYYATDRSDDNAAFR